MNEQHIDSEVNHQVIVSNEYQFVVWPASRRLPPGWAYADMEGSKAELTTYLQQLAVDTLPMPLLITSKTMLDTHWD